MSLIGDTPIKRTNGKVAVTNFAIVTEADLLDKDSFENNANLSGKRVGATFICNVGLGSQHIVAQGGEATSAWLAADGTVVTPV